MSIGNKGGGLSFNSRTGARARASIPGTGISYSSKLGGSKKRKSSSIRKASPTAKDTRPPSLRPWFLVIAIILIVGGITNLFRDFSAGLFTLIIGGLMLYCRIRRQRHEQIVEQLIEQAKAVTEGEAPCNPEISEGDELQELKPIYLCWWFYAACAVLLVLLLIPSKKDSEPVVEPAPTATVQITVEPTPEPTPKPAPSPTPAPTPTPAPAPTPSAEAAAAAPQASEAPAPQYNYVASRASDKYHYPSCRWAKKIDEANRIYFASSADAEAAGYTSCGTCNP